MVHSGDVREREETVQDTKVSHSPLPSCQATKLPSCGTRSSGDKWITATRPWRNLPHACIPIQVPSPSGLLLKSPHEPHERNLYSTSVPRPVWGLRLQYSRTRRVRADTAQETRAYREKEITRRVLGYDSSKRLNRDREPPSGICHAQRGPRVMTRGNPFPANEGEYRKRRVGYQHTDRLKSCRYCRGSVVQLQMT